MANSNTYEVYAIRFATRPDRSSRETFLVNTTNFFEEGGGEPVQEPIDYYYWVIRNADRTVIVDTGFGPDEAKRRNEMWRGTYNPQFFLTPPDGLALLDIDPRTVTDVILTHLHFDHIGFLTAFPSARFHVQRKEVAHVTGPGMLHDFLKSAYSPEFIKDVIDLLYAKRLVFYDGDAVLVPGISLHPLPGHTPGLQGVAIQTARGRVLLAGDSTHYYANFTNDAPFPIVASVEDTLDSFNRIRELADSPAHVIPGHDPQVAKRYRSVSERHPGVVLALHEAEG